MRKKKKRTITIPIVGILLSLAFFVVGLEVSAFFFVKPVRAQKVTHGVTKKLLYNPILFSPYIKPNNGEPVVEEKSGYCLRVPVLFYHHIQPYAMATAKGQTSLTVDNGALDRQMAYLVSKGYTTITVKQLVDALISHSGLPPKSIAITLDDGYRDVFEYAYPIFQKYHITFNLMISTGLVGGGDYMTWDQLTQMKGSGLAYFTDHTWSHYGVGRGSADKIKFEIETGKKQLEDHLGQTVDIFTYPYGSFGATAINILQQDGFKGAFTTNPGFFQCDARILILPRIRIGNSSLSAYGL